MPAEISEINKGSPKRSAATNLPPRVSLLRRGSIACANVIGVGVFIFFQDFDGYIRETQYIKGYKGGTKESRIEIADDVKFHGPLAAVEGKNSDAVITIFYLDRANTIRGLRWSSDDRLWHHLESFNSRNFKAHASSKLACLRLNGDKGCRLYYQDESNSLRELCDDGNGKWYDGSLKKPVIVGSSLACGKWVEDNGDLREIQVFFQNPDNEGKSTWILPNDTEGWREGFLHLPNMPHEFAYAMCDHQKLGYDADVARVYSVDPPGRVHERVWDSKTEEWHHTPLNFCLPEGKLAATWWPEKGHPEIRIFYQGPAGELLGYNFQNGKWHYEHDIPCGD